MVEQKPKKGIKVADPEKLKEQMHKEAVEKINTVFEDEKERAKFVEALKISKLPIEVDDKDFKMGEREVDIRKLSPANKEQLKFRISILSVSHLLDISQSLGDIERLLFAILRKLGVENVKEFLGETISEIVKEANELANKGK